MIGLPSTGIHSNGFSLVRKICFDYQNFDMSMDVPEFGCTLGEKLMTPTRLYPSTVLPLVHKFNIHGMVHETGGAFYENVPRVLPADCDAVIDAGSWEVPVVFKKLQEWGNVAWHEMYNTFNMGIGMILVVDPENLAAVKAQLAKQNEAVYEIGRIEEAGAERVIMEGREFIG